jgi:hypothetical protein
MEKILNKLELNKHLVYIIQEYSRNEYAFLNELNEKTKQIKLSINEIRSTIIWFQTHYSIEVIPTYCLDEHGHWYIGYL